MKNYIVLLIFSFLINIGIIQAQSIEPTQLKYNCKKLLCEKDNNKPYSGKVEGFLSSRQPINLANIRILAPSFNTLQVTPKEEERGTIISLYLVGQVKQGKETGCWQYYYTEDKILLIEANFSDGILDGKLITYYSNGNIESSETYKNGKHSGISTYYLKNGQIKNKSLYENGNFIKNIPKEEW